MEISMPNPIATGWIRPATLVALAAVLASCGQQPGSGPAQAPTPTVGTVILHPEDIVIEADLTGRVEPSSTSEIRPQVDGIVRERLFEEGALVKKGDILYRIDSSTYKARFEKAKAGLATARAVLPSVEAKAHRYRTLSANEAVSKQEVEAAEAALAEAIAQVSSAEADLDSARIDLDHADIRSPISGRIGKSAVTEGALVTTAQATALAVVRSTDEVYVDLVMSSVNLAKIRNEVASGTLEQSSRPSATLILDDGSAYPHAGIVEFSEQSVNQSTGTYTLRATFPNPGGALLPGMFVRAKVQQGVAKGVYRLPQRAVSRNPKGEATALFVWKDGTVESRVLEVARSAGSDWIVPANKPGCGPALIAGRQPFDCTGASDGEQVVVEGSQSARAGSKVKPNPVEVDPASGLVRRLGTAAAMAALAAAPAE
jgi:membrane fusion protein (multidrug efflux system)